MPAAGGVPCDSSVLYFPCQCDDEDVKKVLCATFTDFQQIHGKANGALKTLELASLRLKSVPRVLPQASFYGMHTRKLIIHNASLEVLKKEALKGIQSLELLDLSHNQLRLFSADTIFSINGPKSLKEVILHHNSLERIRDMQGLHLQLLDLSFNTLSDAEDWIKNIPNTTEHLILTKNAIRSLSWSYKDLLSPPLSLRKNVTWIDLSRNQISQLEANSLLRHLPYLKILDLSSNRIFKLEIGAFSAMQELQHLNLSHNFLPFIDLSVFQNLTTLKHVNLSRNLLQSLTHPYLSWDCFPTLETLDLQGNRLMTLSDTDLPPYYFSMMLLLESNPWHCECSMLPLWHRLGSDNSSLNLECSRPPFVAGKLLHTLKEQDLLMAPCESCPRNCLCQKSKKLVDCRHKALKRLPYAIPDWARVMQLDGNQLESLKELLKPTYCRLEEVSVKNNNLSTLMGPMESADEDYTDLVMETRSCASSIRFLSVRNNQLKNISDQDLSLLPNLQQLDLSMNQIVELPFHPTVFLPLLWELDLSHNFIGSLEPSSARAFPHLRALNMSHNNISDICFVAELPELESLDLSRNDIDDLRMKVEGKNCARCALEECITDIALRMVDVSSNKLTRVEQLGWIGSHLSSLAMGNNPWDCSPEHAHQLLEWSKQNEDILEDPSYIRCRSGPSEIVGVEVLHMLQGVPSMAETVNDDLALTASLYAVAAATAALALLLAATWMRAHFQRLKNYFHRSSPNNEMSDTALVNMPLIGYLLYQSDDEELVTSQILPQLSRNGYSTAEFSTRTSWVGIIISNNMSQSSLHILEEELRVATNKVPAVTVLLIMSGDDPPTKDLPLPPYPRLVCGSPTFLNDLHYYVVQYQLDTNGQEDSTTIASLSPQSQSHTEGTVNPAFCEENCHL